MPSAWLRGNKDSLRWHIHDVGRAKASQYQTSIPKLATAMIDPPVAMMKTTLGVQTVLRMAWRTINTPNNVDAM